MNKKFTYHHRGKIGTYVWEPDEQMYIATWHNEDKTQFIFGHGRNRWECFVDWIVTVNDLCNFLKQQVDNTELLSMLWELEHWRVEVARQEQNRIQIYITNTINKKEARLLWWPIYTDRYINGETVTCWEISAPNLEDVPYLSNCEAHLLDCLHRVLD